MGLTVTSTNTAGPAARSPVILKFPVATRGRFRLWIIAVGALALAGEAEVVRGDVADVVDFVAGDEDVLPAVVVVVEEPGGEAFDRQLHAGGAGGVGDPEDRLRRLRRPAVS